MKILISGFAPFGRDTVNSSWEAARRLDGERLSAKVTLLATQIPVSYHGAVERLQASVQAIKPDVVLAVGQAKGRASINPEVKAKNFCASASLDNDGISLAGQPVLETGPAAYLSTLPLSQIIAAITGKGIPAKISYSAGSYVCNYLFYRLMDQLKKSRRMMIGGFIHVPCLPDQVAETGKPSMKLEQIMEALRETARICAGVAANGNETNENNCFPFTPI